MGRAEIRRFQRAAEEAAAFLKPRLDGSVRVKLITHTDSDGISAAAILARCLYFYNVPFSVKFSRPMPPDQIAELAKEDYDMFIFVDQGSGQLEAIHKFILSKGRDVLVVDHHPGEFPEHPNLAYINPHACGLNGAKDASASGAAYSVVEQLDLRFRPLAGLAVVGAIGDRQEFFSGFTGVNDTLVKRAVDLGLLYQSEGLRLVGRTMSPIVECLRLSTRPYIVGLSGDLVACRSLADTLGIPYSSVLSELGPEVERMLADAIFARVGPLATNEEFTHALWGTLYATATEDLVAPRELREYASLLDACCNLRKPEIGFAVAVGDQAAQADAFAIFSSRQEQMLKALAWLVKKLGSFKLMSTFRYLYCGDAIDPAIVGEALSLAIESGLIPTEQPVLALADTTDDRIKVSARSTPGLAMEGIDIGRALAKAAADAGGYGGGHDVAAAAQLPRERMDEFIAKLDQTLSGGGG